MKTSSVPQSSVHTLVKETQMSTTDWCDGANDWGMEEEEQVVIGDTYQTQVNDMAPFGKSEVPVAATVDLDVSQKLQVLTLKGEEENPPPNTVIFRSFYISVMEESDLVEERDLQHAQELLKEYEEREGLVMRELGSCEDGGEEKYEKTKARHGDAVFSRFMKKISLCPEQILRYCWNGSPLFISEPPLNVAQMVPVCHLCGSLKSFEFQLMPALVSLLKSEDSNSQVTLEFGTVLVYTCRNSCWPPDSSSPVEEFVFIQADPDQQLFK
ncbi:programmed cell death protein 2-like [Aplochiton taeniatus]